MSVSGWLGYRALAKGLRLPRSQRLAEFSQQAQTLREIRRLGIDVVLDVGANRGFYAQHLRWMGFEGTIVSFEPDPATFALLREAAGEDPAWHVHNLALGDSTGRMDFNVVHSEGETVLSSLRTPKEHATSSVITVEVETLAEFVTREDLPRDAQIFLKMDTQGYDLNVFEGSTGVEGITLLQSEVSVIPIYEQMPTYTECLDRYGAAGFSLIDLFVVNRTADGKVLEYDALMSRR